MVKRGSVTSEASTTISASHRTNKTTVRGKEKVAKSDKDSDLFKSVKHPDRSQQDGHNGAARTTTHYPNSTSARSFGVARSGKTAGVKGTHGAHPSSTMDKDTLLDSFGIHRKHTQVLDPTLLARGMTARYVGSRVAGFIKTLSSEEIEKDLRHMEAYRCACISYSQKYFAYINQDLLTREMLGFPPTPFDKTMDLQLLSVPSIASSQIGTPIMPSKIDPDEEKRLSELRKKIALSEFKREGIESEYVSYRAHFVYQCHRLLLTRKVVYGQLHLLQDLIQKKGSVVALQRVMCSILKDIVQGLQSKGMIESSSAHSDLDMEHAMEDHADGKQKENNILWETWTALESQLQTAESALGMMRPPKELMVVKNALAITSSSSNSASNAQDLAHMNGMSRRSRSPSKSKGQKDDDDSTINGGTKKKSKIDKDSKGIPTVPLEKGKHSKLNNGDDMSVEKDSLSAFGKKKNLGPEDRYIPWHCLSHPRTPMNIPLLASLLSESQSRFAAYGVGNIMGASPLSMIWLEKNLPKSLKVHEEENKVKMLRDEVNALKAELEREVQMNHNLQKQAITNRRHSDMLCSTMCILRTETEALVERHNIILDTQEVKERASALDPGSMTEEFYDEGYMEEDADMDDDLGADFDHADQGDDSDSVEETGIGEEEDEVDAEPDEDDRNQNKGYSSTIQESSKDTKRETAKTNSNKRSFDTLTVNHWAGPEERKRRRRP